MLKRIFDIVVASLVLVLLAPVLVVVYWRVRTRLGSPALFTQLRPGRAGRPFRMIKFRTMTDARAADGTLLSDAERLTPLGQMLRASSLDELPELWNVIRGDMSLVGPRPLLMDYLPLYTPRRRGGTRCARASPAGRRSTGAMRCRGNRSLRSMSGTWITAHSGWTCGSWA